MTSLADATSSAAYLRKRSASARPEPDWTIQAEVYQLFRPLPHDWHISVWTKVPQVLFGLQDLTQPVPARARSERLLAQIVSQIGFLYQRYGPDEPWPAGGRLHPFACNYCGYRDGCWAWASE